MAGKGYSGKEGSATFGAAGDGVTPAVPATVISEVVKWTLDPSVAINKYNSNKTKGHKRAVAGVRDTKGTVEIKVDGENGTQLAPSMAVSLMLIAGAPDPDDAGDNYFLIDHAIIGGSPVDCDIDEGQIVSMTYNFEASDCKGFGLFAALDA